MDLILSDEALFFRVVQTTPDWEEARDLVRRAKVAVLREQANAIASGKGHLVPAMAALVTRLNDEQHRLNTRIANDRTHRAIKELFGQDGLDRFKAYVAMWRTDETTQQSSTRATK